LEKILSPLAANSGEFAVDFAEQPQPCADGFFKKVKSRCDAGREKTFDDAEAMWNEKLKTALQKTFAGQFEKL
jgi:hypothetical protein